MSLTKALPDSNAADVAQRPETNASGSDASMTGYNVVPFASQQPATSNADISITSDFRFTNVNQGTSLGSYTEQPDTPSSETGS